MKNKLFLILFFAGLNAAAQTTWKIDHAHSDIRFSVSHMAISETDGEFREFDATVVSNTDDFTGSRVEFKAMIASIDTDNERRDGHLKSEDFFNAAAYPELKFIGAIVRESGKYHLDGDLTIRGVTRKIRFDVKYNGQVTTGQGRKAGFRVSGVIDRFDYGLTWSRALETGGLVVGREVTITCNVEMDQVAS